jgi:4-amino-4-deoxy-L-arabinose transferase-like glycosyltransferase
VALAAVLQIATVVYLGTSVSGGDAYTYIDLADDWRSLSALVSPDAFESNFWPAGYPGFLALFSWAGSGQILATRFAQVALAAAVALMAGRLADRVSWTAGTVTSVVVAISPTALWAVWAIGYELLLGFLLLAGLLLALRASDSGSRFAALFAGLLFGLALLVQFRSLLAVIVLVGIVGFGMRRLALTMVVGVMVPLLLWVVRSLMAVGNPAPWSANGPYNLWNGNNPLATGHNIFPIPDLPRGYTSYTAAALDWIIANPADFLSVTARKFLYLFEPTRIAGVSDPFPGEFVVTGIEFIVAAFLVTGILCFVILRFGRGSWELHPLDAPLWFAVAYLLPNIVFIVEARFAIPVHAILVAVAVSGYYVLARELLIRSRTSSTPAD